MILKGKLSKIKSGKIKTFGQFLELFGHIPYDLVKGRFMAS